jgi:hypothetical protein
VVAHSAVRSQQLAMMAHSTVRSQQHRIALLVPTGLLVGPVLVSPILLSLRQQQYAAQSKALRKSVDAPWHVPNMVIRRDLQTPTVREEIRRYSSQYSARLSAHPNGLVVNLTEHPNSRRLRKHLPNDLPTRFRM